MQCELDKVAGLSWGPYAIRFDREYNASARNFFRGQSGKWLLNKLEDNRKVYNHFIESFYGLKEKFRCIPFESVSDTAPFWQQNWVPSFDGIALYGFLSLTNPESYIEFGSGNSTKFARQAIIDNQLRTKIISIDPSPEPGIEKICDELIPQKIEDLNLDYFFTKVKPNDVVFIQNSHRSFQGSDATISLIEIIPHLPSGVIYGLHNIFLPFDYPSWFSDYYYNEQYLLFAYLLGGGKNDQIIFPTWYIATMKYMSSPLWDIFNEGGLEQVDKGGSSFWLKKT